MSNQAGEKPNLVLITEPDNTNNSKSDQSRTESPKLRKIDHDGLVWDQLQVIIEYSQTQSDGKDYQRTELDFQNALEDLLLKHAGRGSLQTLFEKPDVYGVSIKGLEPILIGITEAAIEVLRNQRTKQPAEFVKGVIGAISSKKEEIEKQWKSDLSKTEGLLGKLAECSDNPETCEHELLERFK